MDKLNNFKFQVVKNFLTKDELKIYKAYAEHAHRNNFSSFDENQNNNADTYFYKDNLFEFLLRDKIKLVEEKTEYSLLPTYTFWRCYSYNAELLKHKDRPSCEVSATIQISSDTTWPIFMDGNKVNLEDGDAVIYKGCDLEHWREPFEGDHQIQVFLHYVDANGKYKDYQNDNKGGR
jgi:hypothetical protein